MPQPSYVEHCKRRGWDFLKNAPKAAVKDILAVLQPPALNSHVEDALLLEKNHLEDDFFRFSASLAEKAEVREAFHPLRWYRASQKGNRAKKSEQLKKNFVTPAPSSSRTPGLKKAAKLPPCLNPARSDNHFVKDCTETPDAVMKTLVEDYRSKKQAQGGNISAITF